MLADQQRLIELQAEQQRLENDMRRMRVRISEIRHILMGDKDRIGLTARVETQLRQQAWRDLEPERAAMRVTPEWQEWRLNFLANEKQRTAS